MVDKRDGVGHPIWPHYNMYSRLKSINRTAPYQILIFGHCLPTLAGPREAEDDQTLCRHTDKKGYL